MDERLKDPVISDDEISALNFTPEDILQIEKVILTSAGATNPRKVVAMAIDTLRGRDGYDKWKRLSDIYCAHLIRSLVFRGELVGYGDLYRMRYSEIRLPVVDLDPR